MDILVGHTGFVGQNLSGQHDFAAKYNSANIKDACGTSPDLCVYSGVRSEKFKADSFPEHDLEHIKEALENIKRIDPKRLVLISTVDVIPAVQTGDVFEDTLYSTNVLTPYGRNRLYLENEVRSLFTDVLVVRLPALFGYGLKKNFIYDLIHYVPAMLKKNVFEELLSKQGDIRKFYSEDDNGFFRLNTYISANEKMALKVKFKELGFSALNFTDTRSKFSFYNLNYLWEHIQILMKKGVALAHLASEPTMASEIYYMLNGEEFINEIAQNPFDYTFFKTRYAKLLGGNNGYIFEKKQVISEVLSFVREKGESNAQGN